MLTNKIGFIKLGRNFGFNTFSEFISAISKLKSQGATAFMIDLRGNVGGSLETVVAMVNEFLHKGDLIVYAEGRSFPRIDNYANGSGTCKDDDVVVLVDELSASASEILAGAIQDHDRGLVIGRRTFGKGLVQSQRNFPDESAVRLTVARYYTASGRSIQRRYEKGKYDEYEMDAINRYLEGNYVNVDTASNHLSPYKTMGGRTVYGGDGIMPDVFVARDTVGINSYYNTLVNNRLDERYAMIYSDMNREKLSSFNNWQEMYKYLRQQPLLLNLVSFADNNGIRRRPYYIQESADLLENTMYAYITRNFFGEESFWEVYYREDPLIKKGIELIEKGKTTREAVIREEYKE
jgi:carboxyl-terminal processing protease